MHSPADAKQSLSDRQCVSSRETMSESGSSSGLLTLSGLMAPRMPPLRSQTNKESSRPLTPPDHDPRLAKFAAA